MNKKVEGFSKLNKQQKINWLIDNHLGADSSYQKVLSQYWSEDQNLQSLHDEFAENTISNFYLPFGVAPNFLIDGELYAMPMVIEESSVIAAASKAAKFWLDKGGFKTEVLSFEKIGHVHFSFSGDGAFLKSIFEKELKSIILKDSYSLTQNMQKRGGGILDIRLVDKTNDLKDYYQLAVTINTVDAMGANFINTVLERMAKTLEELLQKRGVLSNAEYQTILCILSNYTPNNIVRASVSCPIKNLTKDEKESVLFAKKFAYAIDIANVEPFRATTHNKGIMNGVDAVVIATGNDFRAVEACAHTYAAKDGQYKSLTHYSIENDTFNFWIDLPIALGTVGGLTTLHPLVKMALKSLGSPDAKKLMGIVAVAGLAQNFAAVQSMVTTGIQKGHMKMHLFNILNQLEANKKEKAYFLNFFKDKVVTQHLVQAELSKMRTNK